MNAYTEFSKIYDELMEDVPYDEWFEFTKKTLYDAGIKSGIVCELGSGTGNFTMKFAEVGFDMIGIDNSIEMLNVALSKKNSHVAKLNNPFDKVSDILYLNQDMREFELYGTVAAIVSVFDSINYVLTDEDIVLMPNMRIAKPIMMSPMWRRPLSLQNNLRKIPIIATTPVMVEVESRLLRPPAPSI